MELSRVTIQDCIENWQYKGQAVLLNDGAVSGFRGEDLKKIMEKGEYYGIQNMPVLRGEPHKKRACCSRLKG